MVPRYEPLAEWRKEHSVRAAPDGAAGQVQRVGWRFALVAATGDLATDAGLTGWPRGTASDAVRRCFNAWIAARPAGIGLSEPQQMPRRARLWFQMHGRSPRFPDFGRIDDDRALQAINQAGYRREGTQVNGRCLFEERTDVFVYPKAFAAEQCNGGNARPMLRLLDSLGHLHKEERDGFTCGLPIGGTSRPRVYWVKASILGDVDE